MATVDVVVSCYQYGRYLRDSVESVLTQDLRDLRVLIIDNASTDNSADVARALAKEDPRVNLVLRERNLGRHASLNEGIDWASSKYLVLLDADDLLPQGSLSRAAAIMDAHPDLSFTYGYEYAVAFDAGVIPKMPSPPERPGWQLSKGSDYINALCNGTLRYIGPTSVMRRTSAQKKAGFHRAELAFTDDLEMFLRLAMVGSVAYTDEVQGIRRLHQGQISNLYRGQKIREYRERQAAFESFFAREGSELKATSDLQKICNFTLSDQAYWSGISHLSRGDLRNGWNLLLYAFGLRPRSIFLPPVRELFLTDRLFKKPAAL